MSKWNIPDRPAGMWDWWIFLVGLFILFGCYVLMAKALIDIGYFNTCI